jgi:hypothetical protein
MFAGDHAGQETQGTLGRAARVSVVDDQQLPFGADDPKPLDIHPDRAHQRMVEGVGGRTTDLDIMARPQAPEPLTARRQLTHELVKAGIVDVGTR